MTDDASPRPPDAVLAALRKSERAADADDLARATGLTPNTVRRTLGMLVAAGEAKRAGGGRFTAVKPRNRRDGPVRTD